MAILEDDSSNPEEKYDDMTPLRRFYNDVLMKSDQPVDIVMSFETLLKSEGMIEDSSLLEPLRAYIFSIAETTLKTRHIREKYMLLPFEIIAPYVDTTSDVIKQRTWYEDSVSHTRSFIKHHSDLCIEEMQDGSAGCISSEICPLVVMNRHLVAGVCNFNLDDVSYLIDPVATYGSANMKLEIASKYDLIENSRASMLQDAYDVAFTQKYPDVTGAGITQ